MTNPGLKTFASRRFERVTYTFELDGKTYYATPGKEADVQLALMNGAGPKDMPGSMRSTAGLMHWLLKAMSKSHVNERLEIVHQEAVAECAACEITQRLSDDNDPLEMETCLDVANWLIGELGKRPTGPSSGS